MKLLQQKVLEAHKTILETKNKDVKLEKKHNKAVRRNCISAKCYAFWLHQWVVFFFFDCISAISGRLSSTKNNHSGGLLWWSSKKKDPYHLRLPWKLAFKIIIRSVNLTLSPILTPCVLHWLSKVEYLITCGPPYPCHLKPHSKALPARWGASDVLICPHLQLVVGFVAYGASQCSSAADLDGTALQRMVMVWKESSVW